MRKKRYMLALRALLKVVPLGQGKPAAVAAAHCLVVRFFVEVRGDEPRRRSCA